MVNWILRIHPDFFSDLDKLDKKELNLFYDQKKKIKINPFDFKPVKNFDIYFSALAPKKTITLYQITKRDTLPNPRLISAEKQLDAARRRLAGTCKRV